jgi:hypothetical protein
MGHGPANKLGVFCFCNGEDQSITLLSWIAVTYGLTVLSHARGAAAVIDPRRPVDHQSPSAWQTTNGTVS